MNQDNRIGPAHPDHKDYMFGGVYDRWEFAPAQAARDAAEVGLLRRENQRLRAQLAALSAAGINVRDVLARIENGDI